MIDHTHTYDLSLVWTGNRGTGTSGYRDYGRDHTVSVEGAGTLAGSADPTFRGDPRRWNPEQLLVAAIAQCHLLTYLHLCVQAGIVVVGYADEPHGEMVTEPSGAGQFRSVTLRPCVTISDAARIDEAVALHDRVGDYCFIARSVNFPIHHAPQVRSTE